MTDKDTIARLKREVTGLQRKLADEQQKSREADVKERDREIARLSRELKKEQEKPPRVETKTVTQADPEQAQEVKRLKGECQRVQRELKEAEKRPTHEAERDSEITRLRAHVARLEAANLQQITIDSESDEVRRLREEVRQLQTMAVDPSEYQERINELSKTLDQRDKHIADLQSRLDNHTQRERKNDKMQSEINRLREALNMRTRT